MSWEFMRASVMTCRTSVRNPPPSSGLCVSYLSKLQNVFVQITKLVCLNYEMYLSKFKNAFVQIVDCICANDKKYLSKLLNMYISPNQKICVFVLIAKSKVYEGQSQLSLVGLLCKNHRRHMSHICPYHKIYLSK